MIITANIKRWLNELGDDCVAFDQDGRSLTGYDIFEEDKKLVLYFDQEDPEK